MGLVDGRRRGRYVDEYEIENITNAGKITEKIHLKIIEKIEEYIGIE